MLGYEKLHDENGRPMHKSWGNAIWFDDAIDRIGADVSRWMFAGQDTSSNMNFGYGPANEVAGRLLKLWNSYRFLDHQRESRGLPARSGTRPTAGPRATTRSTAG